MLNYIHFLTHTDRMEKENVITCSYMDTQRILSILNSSKEVAQIKLFNNCHTQYIPHVQECIQDIGYTDKIVKTYTYAQ